MSALPSGVTIVDVVNLGFGLITAVAASYLAYAALVHSARPRSTVSLVEPKKLRAGETVLFVLSFRNVGYWYAKPMVVNMTIYINFDNTFTPIEMRYGSTQQNRNGEVKLGKGNMKYFKATGMHLSPGEDTEEIHVLARLPETAGRFRIKISAFSENGLSLSRTFRVPVLPALPAGAAETGRALASAGTAALPVGNRPAFVFIGCSGSGATFLARQVTKRHESFAMFVKTTTRQPRLHEINGVDYHFVDDEAFDRLVASGKLVHVKKSDFDTSRYGVDREQLDQIVGRARGPIFSCHSLAEAKSLTECLVDWALSTVCVYVYATENDRRRVLMDHAQSERFEARRETDVRFKREAHAGNFGGCNYLVLNAYDEDATARIDVIVSEVESSRVAHSCDWGYAQESVENDLRQASAAQTKPAWSASPAPAVEEMLRSKRP